MTAGLKWCSGARNGSGGAALSTNVIVDSSRGAAAATGTSPRRTWAVGGEQDRSAEEDHADRIEPVLEAGDDAEVPAAAPNRPEQVGVLGLAGDPQAPVGGHDLDRDACIDRQAVLADEPADPATEGQPGDADRAGVAERRGQAMRCGRLGELDRGETGLCPGNPRIWVDVQATHVGEIEDDAAVDGAMAGEAVAAAADRELELVVAREKHGPRHIARVGCADDRERTGVHRCLVDSA